ncbi:hypothetical protein V6N11_040154 [Hibiscus sabdariffa]|uniref:Transposase MuDR plant domain-containing protein n=1 Tax=Hibiscus sabdariffa TaxID=183260 RepID=A0ABR2RH21_9ROSI
MRNIKKKSLSDDVHVDNNFEDAAIVETSNVRANKRKEEKQKIDRDAATVETSNVRANKCKEEKQKIDRDVATAETSNVRANNQEKEKQKIDRDDGSGDVTNYIHSSDVGSYDSEEDVEVVCKKSKKVFYDPSKPVPCLALGLIFTSTRPFKDALVNYVVVRRFDYKLVRNENDKVNAKCKGEGCPWEIYAYIDNNDGFFKVKKLISQHECSVTFKNSKATYKFIGKHFLGKLRIIPKLTLQEMQRLIKEELHVDVPINLCCKARMWAKEEINGRVKYKFDRLFDYATALRQAGPNCNVDLMVKWRQRKLGGGSGKT